MKSPVFMFLKHFCNMLCIFLHRDSCRKVCETSKGLYLTICLETVTRERFIDFQYT